MPNRKAFTLIEIIVVISIILILLSFLIQGYSSSKNRAYKVACMQNVKVLTQSLALYSGSYKGILPGWEVGDSVRELFGQMYQKDGFNNLKSLVCPENSDGVPPTPKGYGQAFDTDGDIDYWIVFAGNEIGGNLNVMESYGSNVLIIEGFTGAAWTNEDNHKTGGSVGYVSGKAEFLLSNNFPKNKDNKSNAVTITHSNCAK